jgi:hypothetical protein
MTNFFDVAHAHSTPSNKNSAMANSGGLSYSPSEKEHEDFDLPPPYYLLQELPSLYAKQPHILQWVAEIYGLKNFRLTVLGLAKDAHKCNGAKYVCKCSCGMFCLRTAKQMRTKTYQACGVCKQNQRRVIKAHHAKTGVYLTDDVVWQRMGGA